MHVGEYIKWTGQDEDGKFSHTGKIVSISEVWVEFQTPDGLMCVKRTEKLEPAQPVELKSEAKPKVEAAKREPGNGTKLERAVAIYKAMTEPTRQKLIEAFVAQLGMTPAGASTYAAQVRKLA
jgi:hypothetical protein